MILLLSRGRANLDGLGAVLQVGLMASPGNAPRVKAPTPWAAWSPRWEGRDNGQDVTFFERLARRRHKPLFVLAGVPLLNPIAITSWRKRWPGRLESLGLPIGLPLAGPAAPKGDPDRLPWGEFARLALVGDPDWTTSAEAARYAAAAAERGVPLHVSNVHARSPRRFAPAVRFGAETVTGDGWSRLTRESRPVRRLARLLAQADLWRIDGTQGTTPEGPTEPGRRAGSPPPAAIPDRR